MKPINSPRLKPMALGFSISLALSMTQPVTAVAAEPAATTPIKHVIVIVGENHTFDNLYGTYKPAVGQTIDNLRSKGIVNADGTPGPNFRLAEQHVGTDTTQWRAITPNVGSYPTLPQPYTTWAITEPQNVLDSRFPSNLPNGPFQISRYTPYNAYTGDPVHRFFQMWQDVNGGKNDKFVWVEETIGTGSNGAAYPVGGFNPMEGAIAMGFFNMNPYTDVHGVSHTGDAPVFKALADQYAMSDNYHQAVMGGTGANFIALMTGHAAFFTDPDLLDGSAKAPWANQIENPNPAMGTDNYYTQDGYGGGSYVNCADSSQPGVFPINHVLKANRINDNKCEPGHYYLVNNYSMYWNQHSSNPRTLGPNKFVLPPQSAPTIADVMTQNGLSWKYYNSDRGTDITNFASSVDGIPLFFHYYCDICDPLTGFKKIMQNPTEEAKLQNYGAFLNDVANNTLPAVSFVRPFEALAGHPADSNSNLYEAFLSDLISKVKANPELWASTAIIITTDEGGGYYDSGYVQPVDFFGDGTRIPLIVVSPYARRGAVDHTYNDHASVLKFIEKNWNLPAVSSISRDNLPNPKTSKRDPYKPLNNPAVGDLMTLFKFN